MKFSVLHSLFLCLFISYPLHIHAFDYFISIKGLASFSETDDISATGLPNNAVTGNNSKDEVFGLGTSIGIERNSFEYELEYLWRYRIDRGYVFGSRPNPLFTGTKSFFSANTGSHSLMGNIRWNYLNSSKYTPFISLGVGGVVHYSEMELRVPDTVTTITSAFNDNTDMDFTWSAGFGIYYDLTGSYTVGLNYRYTDLGSIDSGAFSNGASVSAGDFSSHDILISFSF